MDRGPYNRLVRDHEPVDPLLDPRDRIRWEAGAARAAVLFDCTQKAVNADLSEVVIFVGASFHLVSFDVGVDLSLDAKIDEAHIVVEESWADIQKLLVKFPVRQLPPVDRVYDKI